GTVLQGIAYAPMRAEVRAARSRRADEDHDVRRGARVLIVMGGTDATGAAGTLAAVCAAADGVAHVSVIAPEHSWDAVRAEAGELACMGVPSLLVAVVENQRAGYEAALAERIARGLGTLEQVRADPSAATAEVERAVADLRARRTWAPVGREKVDGHGAER